MPIELEYTIDNIGVISHAIGRVTKDDILESGKSVFGHKNFKNLRYWIIDREKCTDYDVTLSSMSEIIKLDQEAAKINPNLIVAIVSLTDLEHIRSILYEIGMRDGGFKTNVFRDRNSAEDWVQEEIGKT